MTHHHHPKQELIRPDLLQITKDDEVIALVTVEPEPSLFDEDES